MDSKRRNRLALLTVLLVVLVMTLYRAWPQPTETVRSTSNERGARRGRTSAASVAAPDVHLEALSLERPKPAGSVRNLFRFKPTAPPPAASVRPAAATAAAPSVQTGPPPPTPLPPISLKLTGTVSQGGRPRVAFLVDA